MSTTLTLLARRCRRLRHHARFRGGRTDPALSVPLSLRSPAYVARAPVRPHVSHARLDRVTDTRTLVVAIVGTGLAVITIQIAVMSMLVAGLNTRIDDLRADVAQFRADTRADIAAVRERLRAVDVGFAKVEQRLETLERVILPSGDSGDN